MALVIGVAFCLNSNMAMAQTSSGLELGLQAWTYKNLSFCETLEKAKSFGILYLEAYKGQKLGGGIEGNFGHQMDAATQAAAPYPNVMGVCADTGHWVRSGYDPVESLKKCAGKIVTLHFKDKDQKDLKAIDVPWGTGVSDVKGQLTELLHQKFSGVVLIEYEHWTPQLDEEIGICVNYFRTFLSNVASNVACPDLSHKRQLKEKSFFASINRMVRIEPIF